MIETHVTIEREETEAPLAGISCLKELISDKDTNINDILMQVKDFDDFRLKYNIADKNLLKIDNKCQMWQTI